MEPRIQFAQTSDGVGIAYGEAGEGKPVVTAVAPGFTHAELGWQIYPALQQMASRFRNLWIDFRGSGLSDRNATDFSMESMQLDIEALVKRSGIDKFVLVAFTSAAPIAITYAAAHPDRVSHLVLGDGMTRFSDYAGTPMYRAATGLMEVDWQIYTDTFAQVLWAFPNPEFGRAYGAFLRACSDPETHRAIWKAWEDYDVASLLPSISMPTLVVHNKNSRLVPVEVGRHTAATIPGARFVPVDDFLFSTLPDMVERFVQETSEAEPTTSLPTGTTIILFADIVDSTALTERLGDTAFRDRARDLDATMRTIIRDHSGTAIEGKLLGDGVMAVFNAARDGISAALACRDASSAAGLELHLGLHAGDVIRDGNNVYGGAVNIASRISGLSRPGEVLVSRTVADLARTSAGVTFEDRGEHELKGIAEPQRVFAVREYRD